MGRPQLWRRVSCIPQVTFFKPAGIPLTGLSEACLLVEEAEAIRLKDLEGLEQEECARRMNVSRSTFSRILDSARQKVADALLNGKAIRIQGGNFQVAARRFRCNHGHEWEVSDEGPATGSPRSCPRCRARHIRLLPPGTCRDKQEHGHVGDNSGDSI